MKPRPGYLFTATDCPNRPHPKPMDGICGLCGTDVRAARLGYRLAPWAVILTAALIVGVVGGIIWRLFT